MFAADQRGLTTVLADMEEAARAGGVGSEPAPLLVRLAREGSSFTAWQAAMA
jgi:3-hydroxyacyl-CoA dehydrogenase